jgi:hypothetical protein
MSTAWFAHTLRRCAGRAYMRFLFILQEVRPIVKTRNQLTIRQLLVILEARTIGWCPSIACMQGRQCDAGRWLIESADASQMALGQRHSVEQTGRDGTTMPARSRSTSTFWPVRRREFPAAKARLAMVSFDFAARSSYLARRSSLSSRKRALPPGGQSLRNAALDSAIGQMRVEAAFAAIHAIEGHHRDFHWFNVDPVLCKRLNARVLRWPATRGNVETALGATGTETGCGCASPTWVDDGVVARSNAIMHRLQQTAARFPDLQARLAQVRHWFAQAQVDIFASSHTCLPIYQRLDVQGHPTLIANNGATGLPNFTGTQYGVLTRIATRPYEAPLRCYGVHTGSVYVDALALHDDQAAWEQGFLAQWPAGSDAHTSYWARIQDGPP